MGRVKLEINHKKGVQELDLGQTSIWEGNKNGGKVSRKNCNKHKRQGETK